jgi:predicted DNA-binding transcriptional regulator AlpA
MPRFDHLPPGVIPLAVSRETAAQLLGISAGTFDKLVKTGKLPEPREVESRILWDSKEIEAAWRAMPRRGQPATVNEWDSVP